VTEPITTGPADRARPEPVRPVGRRATASTVESSDHPASSVGHVRGSTLLLAGRVLSLGIAFLAQVVIVRWLAKSDYGAFAYALSIATLLSGLSAAGLDRAVPRFLSIYEEERDDGRFVGTILAAFATVAGLGLVVVLVVVALQGWLGSAGVADPRALGLLAILIVLAPLQALDDLQAGLLAVVSSPASIFVRRYVLAPGLRLLVVGLLALYRGDARFLAVGYVIASAVAVGAYMIVLWRILARSGVIDRARRRSLRFPLRSLLSFSLPLLSTDVVYLVLGASDVVIVGFFVGTSAVADLRAVQPLAVFNQVVLSSFTLLYTPLAGRLFARGDLAASGDAYWRSAVWVAVLSFPIFIVTTALAGPMTTTFFGSAYTTSGTLLAVLATGYYANAALGFNGLTLKIHGHIRVAVVIDLVAAAANVAANLLLVPRLGVLGAALGTAVTLVLHNALKQVALYRTTGIPLLGPGVGPVYGSIVMATGAVWLAVVAKLPDIVILALAATAGLAVVRLSHASLAVAEVFPELRSVPVVGRLVGRLVG
jgi:O-antigen/teichoic acid export membrane protein